MMEFFGILFYCIGLIVAASIFFRLSKYKKFSKISQFFDTFKRVNGDSPKRKDYKRGNYEFMDGVFYILVIEYTWYVFGLLSGNVLIFSLLLITSYLFTHISRKLSYIGKLVFGITFNVIKLILVLFMVLNHFHWHLNLYQLLFG